VSQRQLQKGAKKIIFLKRVEGRGREGELFDKLGGFLDQSIIKGR